MTDALADEDNDVRWLVGEALVALGRDAIGPLLTLMTRSDLAEGVTEGAHHVMHDLAKQRQLSELLGPVLAAFKGPEPDISVPVAAAATLKQLNS